MKIIIPLVLLLALMGCAVPPSTEEISRMDFGNPPVYYRDAIIRYLDDRLKDPGSATYDFGVPERYWLRHANLLENKLVHGYLVKVAVNAKNSFGAYTGKKLHGFLFKDENLILYLESDVLRNKWDYKLGKVEGGAPAPARARVNNWSDKIPASQSDTIAVITSYRAIIRSNTVWMGTFGNRTVGGTGDYVVELPGPSPVCVVVNKKFADGYLELQIESYIATSKQVLHKQAAVRTVANFGAVTDCSKY